MPRLLPILLSTLLLANCGGAGRDPVDPAPPADATPLAYGRSNLLGGLRLTFAQVRADSRCPVDAVCPWAGDAEIEITADPPCYPACGTPSRLLVLHTELSPRSGEYLGWRVELAALTPVPRSGRPIPVGEYVAWLRVERIP